MSEPVEKRGESDPDLYDQIKRTVIGSDHLNVMTDFDVQHLTLEIMHLVKAREDQARSEGWSDGYFEAGGLGGMA